MGKRPAPLFYTVGQVADAIGLCEKTIRLEIKAGRLTAHRFGKQLRISEDDFCVYVAMRRGQKSRP